MRKIQPLRSFPESTWRMKSDNDDRPKEIPSPEKKPEVLPPSETPPLIWPTKEPEIKPEKEPITIPPPPSRIPVPSEEI